MVHVAIPSKGRPLDVRSQKILPGSTIYVPSSEVDDYHRAGVRNLVAVPSDIVGITRTRNWVLDNCGHSEVVFIDDDLKVQGWTLLGETQTKKIPLTEQEWLRQFDLLFNVTACIGYRLWGVSTTSQPSAVYPWRPFIFHTYVTASCMGMFNNGLRFDESFPVKEDYELCLRCIKEDGGIVGARYLFWENEHWTTDGGCKSYRTIDMERRAIKRLIEMYPGMIRQVTRHGNEFSIQLEF